jgi:ATP-dependent Clp protease adapter protein ClpS
MERLRCVWPIDLEGEITMAIELMESVDGEQGEDDAPTLFDVVMINDDITPYLFVVLILIDDFQMSVELAEWTALTIHEDGQAVVMTTTHKIAKKKAADAMSNAQQHNFPLRVTIARSPL